MSLWQSAYEFSLKDILDFTRYPVHWTLCLPVNVNELLNFKMSNILDEVCLWSNVHRRLILYNSLLDHIMVPQKTANSAGTSRSNSLSTGVKRI